jgi:intraflagellar transport protein 80
VEFLN